MERSLDSTHIHTYIHAHTHTHTHSRTHTIIHVYSLARDTVLVCVMMLVDFMVVETYLEGWASSMWQVCVCVCMNVRERERERERESMCV